MALVVKNRTTSSRGQAPSYRGQQEIVSATRRRASSAARSAAALDVPDHSTKIEVIGSVHGLGRS
ncbi:hypothetical protein [Nonomuraea jiangxiensis]|uniref:hypothetical protein n=1 Tax=Nonomuraea jiangxiensis TaxID=633440 RepID=UPI000B869392|nr:hypothetical protein [Nonomuraea jiangxiensis]